ncbi:hypothetical protein [Mesotoga sp. UBA6090]|uniref:hypothetical protein n=1 Tax=Mesotoga sp. UBA6090 TaxID=1946860 RepID=UPI0025F42239|nr:hypothetical protein [Mesotoga sp. UBA6090]
MTVSYQFEVGDKVCVRGGEMEKNKERLLRKYRHKRKVFSEYAADVHVTNVGGTVLWLGDEVDFGDRVCTQEEIGLDGIKGFSRVMRKKIYFSKKGPYITHEGTRLYISEFYRR